MHIGLRIDFGNGFSLTEYMKGVHCYPVICYDYNNCRYDLAPVSRWGASAGYCEKTLRRLCKYAPYYVVGIRCLSTILLAPGLFNLFSAYAIVNNNNTIARRYAGVAY
jgi:hypothetical protein